MRPVLFVPVAVAIGAVALTACASSGPGYYVGASGTEVARVEWSAPQGGHASGTITDDALLGAAPSRSVDAQTVPVTVTFRGSSVIFSGGGLYALAGGSLTGTLSGGALTIRAPGGAGYLESAVLRPATAAVYDSDLATLKERARHNNEIAARRKAQPHPSGQLAGKQRAVSNDESTLSAAVSQLSTDVAQIGTDTQQGSSDLQTLSSDAATGCTNAATVTADDDTVNSDGSTVSGDAITVTSDISTVQSDVSRLQADEQAVLKAGGVPRGNPGSAITQAQSAISTGVSQANADIASMNGYMSQAYSTANTLATSPCPAAS